MAQKPSIPKGTRDFSPVEMARRNYIFRTIEEVFRLYGYQPIETPAMENLSSLMGKYGEEGDRLLFKILNSGDFLAKVSSEELNKSNAYTLTPKISEKGLRYDLTVPFARFVVQNQHKITFPFKRYQIQPVWRADRPQKGRYREFYQCDVDVIGSNSLLNEAELIQIIEDVFNRLHIDTLIKINNRKILVGLAEFLGIPERITDLTVAIDKLEKIGLKNVIRELQDKNVPTEAIEKLQPILNLQGSSAEKLDTLRTLLANAETGLKGIEETEKLFAYIQGLSVKAKTEFDLTLARGLDYYTGAIIEVTTADQSMGSICGGGRYDDLTGIFGLPGVSGVGISFGAERIYDLLDQSQGFPSDALEDTRLLFINFGEKEETYCLKALAEVRKQGINAEIYPDPVKVKKQMNYANRKNIPFVALAGEAEILKHKVTLKNMTTGEQQLVTLQELINILSE
jgi:histidyl-tRNA synthetase